MSGDVNHNSSKSRYRQQGRKRTPKPQRTYHHGSLPQALLEAAETVLKREGLPGLTLRAISRQAGVSHTAARHHFSDLSGVLSTLAAVGHLRLTEELKRFGLEKPPGELRRKAIGKGYIQFAVDNPDLFRLMSRNELLNYEAPALKEGLRVSSRALAGVFDINAEVVDNAFTPIEHDKALVAAAGWGYVHGLANLLIDGRLTRLAASAGTFSDAHAMVNETIDRITLSGSSEKAATRT
ncbi:MAG TPA: TetR/AcrR family transcriptional regulator [Terracidiphilus sp.]|jgi:AcrR family transcriptional regulator|nr:TetR/AcrR family transcriptional regulator [Terracidiphilus sp.]